MTKTSQHSALTATKSTVYASAECRNKYVVYCNIVMTVTASAFLE
ncbi:hypothetical protein CUS_7178 [Ruminococcus albus 8]|uniref:Uncharacterized protein n=1 Tax=Ruminococcus albus 8 TaxID=246199 RepID=E9SDI2_RUMAL|nr:hypothetical protein CUS_7178 [Ruminococcus albus 8]